MDIDSDAVSGAVEKRLAKALSGDKIPSRRVDLACLFAGHNRRDRQSLRLFYDLVNLLPFGVFKILLLAEVKIFVKARRARPIGAVTVKFNPRVKQEQIALP